jgi:hypothetical protein
MYLCQLCRFETPLDDVALRRGEDGCICLACYGRATNSALLMPKTLRRQISRALATQEQSVALDHP